MRVVMLRIISVVTACLYAVCEMLTYIYTRNNVFNSILTNIILISALFIIMFAIELRIVRERNLPLLTKCDLKRFIEIHSNRIKKYEWKYMSVFTKAKILTVANGYLVAGDFEKCKQLLDKVKFKRIFLLVRVAHLAYCRVLCSYYILQENVQSAKEVFEVIRHQYYSRKNLILIKNFKARIDILEGKFEDAEEHFKQSLAESKDLYYKVINSYYLGIIYEKKNDERAKELFKYVVDNGKDLYVAKKAKEYIEKHIDITAII